MSFVEREPEKGYFIKLSDTRPFVWSKMVYPANRYIFNYAPTITILKWIIANL